MQGAKKCNFIISQYVFILLIVQIICRPMIGLLNNQLKTMWEADSALNLKQGTGHSVTRNC
jgi:hypothetical protein